MKSFFHQSDAVVKESRSSKSSVKQICSRDDRFGFSFIDKEKATELTTKQEEEKETNISQSLHEICQHSK